MGGEDPLLVSGACNTSASEVVLWMADGSVVYGIHNLIAYAVSDKGDSGPYAIGATLRGHKKQVTALAGGVMTWRENLVEIYSCGVDGEVLVWQRKADGKAADWRCIQTLNSEFNSTCIGIASMETKEGVYLAVSDAKANVLLWFKEQGSDDFKRFQSLKLPAQQTPHVLHFMSHGGPTSSIQCLLVGSVDARIHVFVTSSFVGGIPNNFIECGVLSGHEEWITCLSSKKIGDNTTLLASGSKDFRTRVWRFVTRSCRENGQPRLEKYHDEATNDDNDDDGDDIMDEEGAGNALAVIDTEDNQAAEARLRFTAGALSCEVFLETLLVGHEDWVTSVQWLPERFSQQLPTATGLGDARVCHLFTASMDRNMILWEGSVGHTTSDCEGELHRGGTTHSQVWTPLTRIGDVGGMLGGSVGANLLGFSAARLSPDGQSLLGVGYGGSFHLYRFQNSTDSSLVKPQNETAGASTEYTRRATPLTASFRRPWRWVASPFLSGHFGAVKALCWSPDGSFFVTCSSDQTARLWAEVQGDEGEGGRWRELSRPQVHGYDLNCVAILSAGAGDGDGGTARGVHRLVSAGDEKMVRVYSPTQEVLRGLWQLAGAGMGGDMGGDAGNSSEVAPRAFIPELKLSTKPVSQISEEEDKERRARGVEELSWACPPLEGQLADFTVWREEHMLFGHSNDIVCLAVSTDGRWLASACKARNANTAAILVRDLSSRGDSAMGATPLFGHDSTVTCLSFSGCGRYLASSGKDRSMCIFRRNDNDDQAGHFQLLACVKGVHRRVVWGLGWLPSPSEDYGAGSGSDGGKPMLVTASRDATCKVWQLEEPESREGPDGQEVVNPLRCVFSFSPFDKTSVTAVSCAPLPHRYVAVGSEAGDVSVWRWTREAEGEWGAVEQWAAAAHCCHGASVRCLAWRPSPSSSQPLQLASCGDDCTVRLHQPSLPE